MDTKRIRKKIISHPITIFLILSAILIILSGIGELLNLQVTYNEITSGGEITSSVQTVKSLLNVEGIRFIFSSATKNFITFAPLSAILIALLGVGVAEKSGLLDVLFKKTTQKINPKLLTFLIVFLGVISNFISEIGFVVLVPLSGVIFLINKRHPVAGMAAAFAGVAGGYAANFLVGPIDSTLGFYTTAAAKIIDSNYEVSANANIFLMIAGVIAISLIGTYITERFIIRKLGKYKDEEEYEEETSITSEEKRGLKYSKIVFITISLLFIYSIIPGLSNFPGSGMLLDPNETTFINQIFGNNSYFQEGITFIVSMIFLLTGIAYGIGSRKVKNDKDVVGFMTEAFEGVGSYIVIIFFASQFYAYFRETQIGDFLVAVMSNILGEITFTGFPLIIVLILAIALINIFVTSPTMKWAVLASTIVPVCMQFNLTPEFAQAIYRVGDSMTNMITPLFAYFAIFLALVHKYDSKNEMSMSKAIKIMIPYSIAFSLIWIGLIISFYLINIPIGVGIYPTL